MRIVRIVVAFCCLAAGALIGALNRQFVVVDLGLWRPASSLGVVILLSLLAGILVGGIVVAASTAMRARKRPPIPPAIAMPQRDAGR